MASATPTYFRPEDHEKVDEVLDWLIDKQKAGYGMLNSVEPLAEMKLSCEPYCFSTLNHIVGWCYNDARVIKWLIKQARHGFQGIRGNFE